MGVCGRTDDRWCKCGGSVGGLGPGCHRRRCRVGCRICGRGDGCRGDNGVVCCFIIFYIYVCSFIILYQNACDVHCCVSH